MQFAINDNDASARKSNRKCHSIYLCYYSLRFGELRLGNRFVEWNNQLQKYLTRLGVFWHKWSVYYLVLVTPLHPLSKLLAIQDHTQTLEEQYNFERGGGGGGRSVLYLTDQWLAVKAILILTHGAAQRALA